MKINKDLFMNKNFFDIYNFAIYYLILYINLFFRK